MSDPTVGGTVAEPVRVRRLTDQEGQRLQQIVRRAGTSSVRYRRAMSAPLGLTPKHGFWIFDEERVIVETINTKLSFDAPDDLALYGRVWDGLHAAAVHGAQAHRLIARARHLIAPL